MILVTGGAGYIGVHLVATLLALNYKVVVLDNFTTNNGINLSKLEFNSNLIIVKGDVRCQNILDKVFTYPITRVIHLAGLKSIPQSFSSPQLYHQVNYIGSVRLINTCIKHGVVQFIYSSSASVYRFKSSGIYIESDETTYANNPYSKSKLMVENYLDGLTNAMCSIDILRYFNPVGYNNHLAFKDENTITTNLFPVIQHALMFNKPIWVYGNDYATKDGSAIRDYIHIEDIVNAHVRLLRHTAHGCEVYNVGCNKGHSVNEVIEEFKQHCLIQVKQGVRRSGDLPVLTACSDKLKQDTGWTPVNDLSEMVSNVVTNLGEY